MKLLKPNGVTERMKPNHVPPPPVLYTLSIIFRVDWRWLGKVALGRYSLKYDGLRGTLLTVIYIAITCMLEETY